MQSERIAFTAPGAVTLESGDIGEAGPGEVMIETAVSLISTGTELALYRDTNDIGGGTRYPLYPGYAACGVVAAVGGGISDLAPGQRIFAATPHASHARFDPMRTLCLPLPEAIADDAVPFVRMSLITLAALCRADIRPGEWLGVVGLGIVGNLGAQLGRASGYNVLAVGRSRLRSERAARCGIATILSADDADIAGRAAELTGGSRCRFVLETSGTSAGLMVAEKLAGTGGTISLVGVPWRNDDAVALSELAQPLFHRYLTVKGGWEWDLPLYRRTRRTEGSALATRHSTEANALHAIELITRGAIVTEPMVTHDITPGEVAAAYKGLANRREEYMGVRIRWRA